MGAALAVGSAWGAADPLASLPVCTSAGLRKVTLRTPQLPPVAMLHPERLARFVDPLPVPAIVRGRPGPDPDSPGRSIAYERIVMREAWGPVHRDLPPTRYWGYEGTLPGPTIEVQSGQPLLIEWANELPGKHLLPIDQHAAWRGAPGCRQVRTRVVHVHGARVPSQSDGYPEHWYTTPWREQQPSAIPIARTPRRSGTTTTRWASGG